jgi:hypothetical protein
VFATLSAASNRFNGFVPLDDEKPLETVHETIVFLDHRAKATV